MCVIILTLLECFCRGKAIAAGIETRNNKGGVEGKAEPYQ